MGCSVSVEMERDDDSKQNGAKAPEPVAEKKVTAPPPPAATPAPPPPVSQSTPASTVDFSGIQDVSRPARKFKLRDLEKATKNFDESALLGEGSFGKVYKGFLNDKSGMKVGLAVKKLNAGSFQGIDEWLAEVLLLDKLKHPNLVSLIGYCTDRGEALLAYELCPKGSLDVHLFESESIGRVLSWEERVKIAQETARGLAYLHDASVIHRDLKPSNILLMEDMTPKLTDFGMAKESMEGETHVSTRVMGTLGYLDPTYMETGHLRDKSDVYAFGIILLELLTGKRALNNSGESLTAWVRPLLTQRKPDLNVLVDPKLDGKYPKAGAVKLAIVAKHCINDTLDHRPDMHAVIENLDLVDRQ